MNLKEVKRSIVAFVYGERLKSALIVASQLLDVFDGLSEQQRQGALEVLSAFVNATTGEMRLAASVLKGNGWQGLESELQRVEGHVRLTQMERAREDLSRLLSRVTTLSGNAMTSLKNAGLL